MASTTVKINAVNNTKAAFNSVDKGLGNLDKSVGRLSRGMAGLSGGLAIAGLVAIGKNALDSADKLQKLSIRLGASTEALSQYQHVAKLTGVSFETLTMGWQRMTRRVSEAAGGFGEAKGALQELGISAKYLNTLAPEKQFAVLADALKGVGSRADKVRLAMKLWDSEGVSLLQTIEGGSAGLREMTEEAEALGLTLSQDAADAAARANDEFTRMGAGVRALTVTFVTELGPAIGDAVEWFNNTLPEAIDTVKSSMDVLIATIASMAQTFNFLTFDKEGVKHWAGVYTEAMDAMAERNYKYSDSAIAARAAAKELDIQFNNAVASIDALDRAEGSLVGNAEKANRALNKQVKTTRKKLTVTEKINKDLDKLIKGELFVGKTVEKTSKLMDDYTDSLIKAQREVDLMVDKEMAAFDAWQDGEIAIGTYQKALEDLGHEVADVTEDIDETWSNMTENMQRAFGDLIYDNIKSALDDGELSFKTFTDTILDMFLRMLADMAAAFVASKIFGGATGSGGLISGLFSGAAGSSAGSSIGGAIGGKVASTALYKSIFGKAATTSSGVGGTGLASGGGALPLLGPNVASSAPLLGPGASGVGVGQSTTAIQANTQAVQANGAAMAGSTVAAASFVAAIAGIAIMGAMATKRREAENAAFTDQFNQLRTQTNEFAGELLVVNDSLTLVGQSSDAMYLSLTGTQAERQAQLDTYSVALDDIGAKQRLIFTDSEQVIAMITGSTEQLAQAADIVAAGFDNAQLVVKSFMDSGLNGMTTLSAKMRGDTEKWKGYFQGALESGKLSADASFRFIEDASGRTTVSLKGDANEWAEFLKSESRIAADSFAEAMRYMDSQGEQAFAGLSADTIAFQGLLNSLRVPDLNMPAGTGFNTGFATGGSFIVGGSGGTDTTPVGFMATRGERVTVETPNQQRRSDQPINITIQSDGGGLSDFIRVVADDHRVRVNRSGVRSDERVY